MNQRQQQRAPIAEQDGRDLMAALMAKPMHERHRLLDEALTARTPKIEEVLPDFMKGQAERLIKRAMITFQRNPDLQQVPPAEFVRCVLEAAEMGFAIDGKMCYVVKYKNQYQCQLDYKGIVAVARRMKTIVDIYSDVVCENDTFRHGRRNGESILEHSYEFGHPRGEVIGAYAVVKLPGGEWRYEAMDREALDRIQRLSPSQNGPWKGHPDEMRKKTVIRRCLKMYGDDPGLIRVLSLTDEYDGDEEDDTATAPAATVRELSERFAPPQARQKPPPAADYASDYTPAHEAPQDTYERPQATEPIDPNLIDSVRWRLEECDSADLVEQVQNDWISKCESEAETNTVIGLCEARRKALAPPAKGAKKQSTLAGVS